MRSFAPSFRRLSGANRGLTLIELMLSIGLVGALSAMVVVGAYKSGQTRDALAQGEMAVAFGQAIERAWTTHPDYSSLSAATAAPYAPAAYVVASNSQGSQGGGSLSPIQSTYGAVTAGPVATTSYTGINPVITPPSFALQYNGLPRDLCAVFAGSASSAYDNVIINGNAAYAKVQGGMFDPGLAAQQCNRAAAAGGNTVAFTRMRTYPVNTSGFCLTATAINPQPYSPASLTDAMWHWIDAGHFTNTVDHTTYYTNPPKYDRLFAPDGSLVC